MGYASSSLSETLKVLLLLCFLPRLVQGVDIIIDPWTISEDGISYPAQNANVGDRLVFNWFVIGSTMEAQPTFSVDINPSGTCDDEGKIIVGDGALPEASYVFTAEDSGKTIFFASNQDDNCEKGMQVEVSVAPLAVPTLAPTPMAGYTGRPILGQIDFTVPANDRFSVPTIAPSVKQTTPSDNDNDTGTDNGQDESRSETANIMARTTYTIVVRNGRESNIPLTLYKDLLTYSTLTLANEIVQDMFALEAQRSQKLRETLVELDFLQSSSSAAEQSQKLRETLVEIDFLQSNSTLPTNQGDDSIEITVDDIVGIDRVDVLAFTATPRTNEDGVFAGGNCPSSAGSILVDRCERITSSIGLVVESDELDEFDLVQIQEVFEEAMNKAILAGRLQSVLLEAYPASKVFILTGQELPIKLPPNLDRSRDISIDDSEDADDEPVSSNSGRIIALIIVILIGVIACFAFELCFRRLYSRFAPIDNRDESASKGDSEVKTIDANGLEWGSGEDDHLSYDRNVSGDDETLGHSSKASANQIPPEDVNSYAATLDALYDTYSSTSLPEENTGNADPPTSLPSFDSPEPAPLPSSGSPDESVDAAYSLPLGILPGDNKPVNYVMDAMSDVGSDASEEYSYTGSSAVGSREGSRKGSITGNLETMSDGGDDESGFYSSSAGSVSSSSLMQGNRVLDFGGPSPLDMEHTPGISNLDDLEAAVLAGDWGAVGATANVLATGEYETDSEVQSLSKASIASYSVRSNVWEEVIDATKAAELDQFITNGDWASLIDAAARYEEEAKEITSETDEQKSNLLEV